MYQAYDKVSRRVCVWLPGSRPTSADTTKIKRPGSDPIRNLP